ncbi:MAG: TetR/AcrR family transcriptional regulator [Candidatus Riflebacteria bacterium]|nr:TetR/AcrR family transcriptional regulator [Candidatus Riflebacteria bacterium]
MRTPSTRRGEKTRGKLLERAVLAFTREGFHATSVASICRAARVANGSFYQYFPDKLAVFTALVDRLRDSFRRTLQGARGIAETGARVFSFFDEAGPAFQVFREAEFLEVPHPRGTFYDEAAARLGDALDVDEATAWGVFGALIMAALHFGVWENRPVPDPTRGELLEVIARGIADRHDDRWRDLSFPDRRMAEMAGGPAGRAEETRRALVAAARRLFARQGYAATRISQITDAAGVGLGTFYGHFPAKRDLLDHLVEGIRLEMRQWVGAVAGSGAGAAAARGGGRSDRLDVGRAPWPPGMAAPDPRFAPGPGPDPLEAERLTFLAFMAFIRHHGDVYRIVREAEFAEPDIGRRYYHGIHADRIAFLSRAQALGRVRAGNPSVQAAFLMGVEALAGLRWVIWGEASRQPPAALRATLRLMFNGLAAG